MFAPSAGFMVSLRAACVVHCAVSVRALADRLLWSVALVVNCKCTLFLGMAQMSLFLAHYTNIRETNGVVMSFFIFLICS